MPAVGRRVFWPPVAASGPEGPRTQRATLPGAGVSTALIARSDVVTVAEEKRAPIATVLWVRGPSGPHPAPRRETARANRSAEALDTAATTPVQILGRRQGDRLAATASTFRK